MFSLARLLMGARGNPRSLINRPSPAELQAREEAHFEQTHRQERSELLLVLPEKVKTYVARFEEARDRGLVGDAPWMLSHISRFGFPWLEADGRIRKTIAHAIPKDNSPMSLEELPFRALSGLTSAMDETIARINRSAPKETSSS